MSFVSVTVKLPDLDVHKRVSDKMPSIYKNAGARLARCIRNWMRDLESNRHGTANRLGATPTGHFKATDVQQPVVSNEGVTVAVNTPGISRAYHDIDIDPVNGQFLTIPLHAEAYGISAREFEDMGKGNLFRIYRPGSSTEKGKVLYTMDGSKNLVPMYALTEHVHQVQDPSLMPSNDTMTQEAIEGAVQAIKFILRG